MSSNPKNYNETVNFLYGLQRHGIKLGLENPRRLMNVLGEPQKSFRSVHIAGTNGKGSTATIIASILKRTGVKVGLYTSPHLVSFTERIRVNNKEIAEHEVIELTNEIRNVIQNSPSLTSIRVDSDLPPQTEFNPTFFEFVTAMAFLYFKRKKVNWAVVEVGMGGRLDATNVLLPDVSIITNIGLDHNEFLGGGFLDIAFEKAGIIKPTIPVATATTHPEALRVLEKTAKDHGSEIHIYNKDFKSTLVFMDDKRIVFDYRGTNLSMAHANSYREYNNLSLPIPGKHQLYNVSLAIRVCEILTQRGLSISGDVINNGLLNLNFEGRFERVSQTPLIIIDSAHNPEAARALSDTVKEIFPAKKVILIVGIMKDKDIKGILEPLMQISDAVILTRPKGERAASTEKLKENIKTNIMPGSISTTNTVAEAIEFAKTLWQEDNIILVTGSFYTTGEVKELLGHTTGVLSQLRE
jgi:dihydrofolate synthase/folylpolyglutamate synthase